MPHESNPDRTFGTPEKIHQAHATCESHMEDFDKAVAAGPSLFIEYNDSDKDYVEVVDQLIDSMKRKTTRVKITTSWMGSFEQVRIEKLP